MFPNVLSLQALRCFGYVPQQTGYQGMSIIIVPGTLPQKHGFR
jgi:hypothetical protein